MTDIGSATVILENVLARLRIIDKKITELVAQTANLSKRGNGHAVKIRDLSADAEPLKKDVQLLIKKMRSVESSINGLKKKAGKKAVAGDDEDKDDGE